MEGRLLAQRALSTWIQVTTKICSYEYAWYGVKRTTVEQTQTSIKHMDG